MPYLYLSHQECVSKYTRKRTGVKSQVRKESTAMCLSARSQYNNRHVPIHRQFDTTHTKLVSDAVVIWGYPVLWDKNKRSRNQFAVAVKKIKSCPITLKPEPGWRSRYSDSLQAWRSGDRIPVEARFSAPIQTGSEAHPASCTMGTGSFPGVKTAGAWCWPPTPI
jgi:hypothetical protein